MIFQHDKTGECKEIIFRNFKLEDAQEIVNCLIDAYGNTYVKPYLYAINTIIRMYEENQLIFTVAENPEDGIIGMLGNERSQHFDGQNEFVTQVVKRKYKGYGIAKANIIYNMEHLKLQNYNVWFGYALGTHLISQLTFTQLGFTACGFLLSVFIQDKLHMNYQKTCNKKVSQALVLKYNNKVKMPKIFVDDSLHDMVRHIYNNLGVVPHIVRNANEPTRPVCDIIFTEDEVHQTLLVYINTCGRDLVDLIESLMKQFKTNPYQTMNIYLNMEDKTAVSAYQKLRTMGFIFTGIHPGGKNFEYMILHHPMDVAVDMDEIPYIEDYKPFVELIKKEMGAYV